MAAFPLILLYPMGLAGLLAYDQSKEGLLPFLLFGSYFFYLIHLYATLTVRSKNSFHVLLWILVVFVVLNLAGCEAMLTRLHNAN